MPATLPVPNPKYGLNDQVCVRKVVTSAQILAMFGAAQSLFAAPGAGYAIVNPTFHVQTVPGTVNYAGGGVVTFVYTGGSVTPHGSSIAAATVTSGTGTNNLLPPNPAVVQPPANTGISITNASAAFTAGTGTFIVTMWCTLLKLN